MSDNVQQPSSQDNSYVDDYKPVSSTPTQTSDASSSSETTDQEALENQNIFVLLGVDDGTEQEKEAFLDELQLVIRDDFIENDVQLLVTESEMNELKQIMGKQGEAEEVQEELVVYLEKLIPDLEEIMLEKALELKEDMVKERIAGMKEYYQGNQSALDALAEAERLADQNKWKSVADKLNSIA